MSRRPGAFEEVLARSIAGRGNPYHWLSRAVSATANLVLDIGCGAGAVSRQLQRPGRTVIGLDLSEEELTLAAQRDTGPWVLADGRRLPFSGETFDAVTTSMGLAVIWPVDALLGEIGRVLKPGGLFVGLLPSVLAAAPGDIAMVAQLSWQLRSVLRLPGAFRLGLSGEFFRTGLSQVEDARQRYHYRIASRSDAERLFDALELDDVAKTRSEQALAFIEARVMRDGEFHLGIPLRRVVAIK